MRIALGADAYMIIKGKCEDTIKLLDEWKDVTSSTDVDQMEGVNVLGNESKSNNQTSPPMLDFCLRPANVVVTSWTDDS